MTLRKEELNYAPFTFALTGSKKNSLESWSRRYYDAERAILHVLNRFNENANIKNRYNKIEDFLKSR